MKGVRTKILVTIVTMITIVFSVYVISSFKQTILAQDTEDISTTVSVDNNAPTFTVSPYENDDDTTDASTDTTPTNQGDDVNIHATGTDQDSNQYYLAVCSTSSITAGDDGPPTCDATEYCVSTATDSGVATQCDISTNTLTSESYDWYAFVCDKVAGGGDCSSSDQGSGDSGSPFIVNHGPTYTAITDDSDPYLPGETINWTTTASDDDVNNATDDDLYLLMCDSSGVTQTTPYAAPTCNGTQLGLGSASLTNPTASYTLSDPAMHGTYTPYGYVYDQHNKLAATAQADTYTITNLAPTVTIDTVPGVISLTESGTIASQLTLTISDDNGYSDVTSGSVVWDFYGDWLAGHSECDTSAEEDGDDCYRDSACSYDADGSGKTAGFTCTVNMQYFAESTSGGNEQHASGGWISYVTATDGGALTGTDDDTSLPGSDVDVLVAFDIPAEDETIAYGNMAAGTQSSNVPITVNATGNARIDLNVKAANSIAFMCTDYPTCSGNTIDISNQHFDDTTITWPGGTALTTTDQLSALQTAKTYWNGTSTVVGSAEQYWMLNLPGTAVGGNYSGLNTLTAVHYTTW